MNSNSLFQSIQALEGLVADYNHLLQTLNKNADRPSGGSVPLDSSENN